MTGLVRKATLLSACGLLLAGAAMAGIPNAANSPLPTSPLIIADGDNPGAACHTFAFVVRDALNNPVAGSDVVLDFSTCAAGDAAVCLTQPDAGVTVTAIGKTVLKTTDGLGAVSFRLLGQGTNPGLPPPTCVKVYASGNLLGTVQVRIVKYDLDGTGSVGGSDGTIWGDRFLEGAGVINAWCDYDCTGIPIGGSDGTLWGDAFLLPLVVCLGPTW